MTEALPKRRSATKSAFIVMCAMALSAVLGFGREIVTAHFYGTRAEMDAFLNAATIPTIVFGILSGALINVLVPTFSEYASQGRDRELRKLGSTVLNTMFLVTCIIVAAGWMLAPWIVPITAQGFPPAEQSLVIKMLRLLLPGIVATSLGGVCSALLNATHRFLSSSLVWVAANLVTIAFVLAFHRELGIFALVLGTLSGLFAQLFIQIPSVLRGKLYDFSFDLRQPGLLRSWALILPAFVGSGAWQASLAFDRYFASTLNAGSTAAINYTTKLVFLPIPIIAGAIATVSYPMIAGLFVNADLISVRRRISLALRMVSFIVIPSALGLITLAYPIVKTLFQRGAFNEQSTALCASLIPFACITLLATSFHTFLGRACYACKRVRLAVSAAVIAVVINVALSKALLPFLGARGLLLANGISGLSLMIMQLAILWRALGGFEWRPFLLSFAKTFLAAGVMATSIQGITLLLAPLEAIREHGAIFLVMRIVAGGAIFLGTAKVFSIEELTIATRALTTRLLKSRRA